MENSIKGTIFGKYKDYILTKDELKSVTSPQTGHLLFIYLYKGNNIIREIKFPAYKIYNLSAHLEDIVLYEEWLELPLLCRSFNYPNGYEIAAWNGLSNLVSM